MRIGRFIKDLWQLTAKAKPKKSVALIAVIFAIDSYYSVVLGDKSDTSKTQGQEHVEVVAEDRTIKSSPETQETQPPPEQHAAAGGSRTTTGHKQPSADVPVAPEPPRAKGMQLGDEAFKTAGYVTHEDVTYIHLPVPVRSSVDAYKRYLGEAVKNLGENKKTLSADYLSNFGVHAVRSPHVLLIPEFLLKNMSADTQRDMARLVEYAVADSQRVTEHYGSSEEFAYVYKMDGNIIRLIRDQNADMLDESGPNDNQPLAQFYSSN